LSERRGEAVGPGGGNVGEVEEEGIARTGGEGGEGGTEGVVVAEEKIAVLWDAWVEPAAVLEKEVAGGAARSLQSQIKFERLHESVRCMKCNAEHCSDSINYRGTWAPACSGLACGSARRRSRPGFAGPC
jgi:hypothetical protein